MKIFNPKPFRLPDRWLVVNSFNKAGITLSKVTIGDVGINSVIKTILNAVFAMTAGV